MGMVCPVRLNAVAACAALRAKISAFTHFSSNWTSRVRGGKSHELVVSVVGMLSGDAGQSDDGVAIDADQPSGGADAAALIEVLEHGEGLLLGEMAVEQGRALA